MVLCLLLFCLTNLLFKSTEAKTLYVIDIGVDTADVSLGEKLAVLACQGLMNRDDGTGEEEVAVYTIRESWDKLWLETAIEYDPELELFPLTIAEYLSDVCEKQNFPKIVYSKELHHEVIPEIITVAGVLDAVPLDIDSGLDQLPSWMEHEIAFDAGTVFLNFTELEATEYIFENYGYLTSGVSMMNPGWRQPDNLHPAQADLVRDPDVGLADFLIKERMFNFFLYQGCVPLTVEHTLMRKMMTDEGTSWKKPVEVFGYNDAVDIFGGWFFEAETTCIQEHNMGQVASSGQNNFSFFNRKASIQSPEELEKYLDVLMKTRQDIAEGAIVFDPNKTYMTFILGDGDNIAFMKGGRRGWMQERTDHCRETDQCTYPLAWSMSPHLLYLAPDWLHWYYSQANATGQDVFVLPPSGHLYAYPGMMNGSVLDSFVESTQQDCKLLSATGSVHWEWFYGWQQAFDRYFPQYATSSADGQETDSCVKSFFGTDVPYNLPTNVIWTDHFIMLEGDVVVFKPREWRGTNKDGVPIFAEHNYLTEEEMAAEINGYDKGSVSHLYLTSDGGMNLPTVYKMISMLDDHVKVVNHEELTEMARQKTSLKISDATSK